MDRVADVDPALPIRVSATKGGGGLHGRRREDLREKADRWQ